MLGTPLPDGHVPITGMRPTVREETPHLSTAAGSVGEDAQDGAGDAEEMGVDPVEISVKDEIAEKVVMKPNLGHAKAAAPPMPKGVAGASASSSGTGSAAKAPVPPIPSPANLA